MKKLIISAELLKPALAKLAHVVQQKSLIPAASSLYCKVTPNQLELIGTNTEITIIIKLVCESQETFDFLLPFECRLFWRFVSLLQAWER
ncbi:MAG: hypothetical protein EOP49_08500 [Sphingobacteriales bacterium]|nr:MAG: hypothetical protein EOP49_08500 [Sphingobacteriales bacterium]